MEERIGSRSAALRFWRDPAHRAPPAKNALQKLSQVDASIVALQAEYDTYDEQSVTARAGLSHFLNFMAIFSVNLAVLNLLRFFEDESCGQCTPCRNGCDKAVKLLENPRWDRALLGELSDAMRDASICGLGQAAPNPVLSVMKYFEKEVS